MDMPTPATSPGSAPPATARPRLKDVRWRRSGDRLQVVYDIRDHFLLTDPDGTVEALLELLREGGRTVGELAARLCADGRPLPADDIAEAVALLDAEGLIEDTARAGDLGPEERERYHSNLAFFESFSSMTRSRDDLQRRLREAHVLVLGTGGLNSNTIPHLCGLGVGRLTLLDRDAVEPRNFARQYLYRHEDIGARKVEVAAEWVRRFDPTVAVEALDAEITGADRVTELIDRYHPDVVMSGVDSPDRIDDWVNQACVGRGVPFVRGGMWVTLGLVYSIEPGVSACRACYLAGDGANRGDGGNRGDTAGRADPAAPGYAGDDELAAFDLFGGKPRVNRGIGPVAGLLGALCAFEVLRYLTRFEEPAYAGRPALIDFAGRCATWQGEPWPRNPGCRVCAGVTAGATVDHAKGGDR